MKKRRPSARINVLLPTLGLILLLLSLPTYFTYKNMENIIIRQLGTMPQHGHRGGPLSGT